MNEDVLKKRLKDGVRGSCYLFCGVEEYLKDYYIGRFLKRVRELPMSEFNLVQFDGKSFSAAALAEALQDLPYMSDYKLVCIGELNLSKLAESEVSDICAALEDIPEYADVLFAARKNELSEKLLARKEKAPVRALLDFVEKRGLLVNFEKQTGAKLKQWVRRHFSAAKVPIDEGALELMISLCGEDMYTLHGEAAKLCAYCKGRSVGQRDVAEVCCANESYRVFDLTKALTAGDVRKLHDIYGGLIKSGSSPFMIMNLLSSCIADMTVVKAGIEAGKTVQEMARTLKTFDWAVRNYIPYVRRTSYEYLEYAAAKCSECALALKTYRTDAECDVEFFLLRLSAYEKNQA